MIVTYKKKANVAAAIWLSSCFLLAYIVSNDQGNIWESGNSLGIGVLVLNIASYWYAFWAYAKAKGRSGILGLILPIFSILGLLTLAALSDLHPDEK